MGDDVEQIFQPTRWGWMKLARQRLRSGKEEKVIIQKFKEIKRIRKQLKKIEENLGNWSKQMKTLFALSRKLASAVETEGKTIEEAVWNGDVILKDDVSLQNVREKIRRLDEVLAQRSTLRYIKLKGDYAQHKLEKLRRNEQRESYERQSTRFLSIQKEAVHQREDILDQVIEAVDSILADVGEYGVAFLVKPQLQSFKMAQFQLFLVCQKLIQGRFEDAHLKDLEDQLNVFADRIAENLPTKQAVGRALEHSHPFLKEQLDEEAKRRLTDFSSDEDEEETEAIPPQTFKKSTDSEVVQEEQQTHSPKIEEKKELAETPITPAETSVKENMKSKKSKSKRKSKKNKKKSKKNKKKEKEIEQHQEKQPKKEPEKRKPSVLDSDFGGDDLSEPVQEVASDGEIVETKQA